MLISLIWSFTSILAAPLRLQNLQRLGDEMMTYKSLGAAKLGIESCIG